MNVEMLSMGPRVARSHYRDYVVWNYMCAKKGTRLLRDPWTDAYACVLPYGITWEQGKDK